MKLIVELVLGLGMGGMLLYWGISGFEADKRACVAAGRDFITMDARVVCKDRVTEQLFVPAKP
jgi:hypothetical protein